MPDQPVLKVAFPKQTRDHLYNQEVASLLDLLSDFTRQVTACSSAKQRNWKAADLTIIRQTFDRLNTMVDNFAVDPEQYFPNADSTPVNVHPSPDIMQPENHGAQIIVRQVAKLWGQLRNGASGKQCSGFHTSELSLSIMPALEKLDKYIAEEQKRKDEGIVDYMPEVSDQEQDELTPGDPDNQTAAA